MVKYSSMDRRERSYSLVELSALVNSSLDINEIKKRAIEAATRLVDSEAGSLLFLDETTGELYFDVAIGEKGEEVKTIRLKRGEGIAGWVAEHREPVIIDDVQNDRRFSKRSDSQSGFLTRDMICLPVKTKERLVGVLEVINKRSGVFDKDDLELLGALSNQVAIAIENARLYDELRETFYSTVHALADTIEKRDPYTGGHTKRVMEYSLMTGRVLGLKRHEMVNLELAAILHDIGKIGVRDNILLKNGRLLQDEQVLMMMHPLYGSEILGHIRQLKDVIPGVRSHHERYDGCGYPDGLKGKDIPVIARIISVADTFDAMTTDRPYRKGLSPQEAFDELKRNAGTQFDPDVVDAFITAYHEEQRKGKG